MIITVIVVLTLLAVTKTSVHLVQVQDKLEELEASLEYLENVVNKIRKE